MILAGLGRPRLRKYVGDACSNLMGALLFAGGRCDADV